MATRKLTKKQWEEVKLRIQAYGEIELRNKTTVIYHLSTILNKIKREQIFFSGGICTNTNGFLLITAIGPYWDKCSKDTIFPIFDKTNTEIRNPLDQYTYLPKWEDKQLELRIDLIKFLQANVGKYYALMEQMVKEEQ